MYVHVIFQIFKFGLLQLLLLCVHVLNLTQNTKNELKIFNGNLGMTSQAQSYHRFIEPKMGFIRRIFKPTTLWMTKDRKCKFMYQQ